VLVGEHAGAAAILLLSSLPAALLLIVVLGDGYADTAKQSHLATAMLLAGWLCIPMGAARWFAIMHSRRIRQT
jgi:hypothetical protein